MADKLRGRAGGHSFRLGVGWNPRHLHLNWVPCLDSSKPLRGERGTVNGEPCGEAGQGSLVLRAAKPGLNTRLPVAPVSLDDATKGCRGAALQLCGEAPSSPRV